MLVFVSDIHLTDGTSGETIRPGAFEKFVQYLELMARDAGARQVEVVLLGDIFDVIRSDKWPYRPESTQGGTGRDEPIRPWSAEEDVDANGKGLKDYADEITRAVCENEGNRLCGEHLRGFRKKMKEATPPIDVKFTYIIGNHDWLIDRYGRTRRQIAEFLGLDDAAGYERDRFRRDGFWPEYRVFARHGDVHDEFNFEGDRDASSLGDAIVIDLLNRFPQAVEREIGETTDPDLIRLLREIDNVRPLLDAPLWVDGACRRAKEAKKKATADAVKKVWDGMVDDFLNVPFVKAHNRWFRPDPVDKLRVGLKLSKFASLRGLADLLATPLRKLFDRKTDYTGCAHKERMLQDDQVDFVVYGHTHRWRIQPLDKLVPDRQLLRRTYFNTGTWRRVHERARFGGSGREFSGWHVMTFIAFYLPGERRERRFEVWNGALDHRPGEDQPGD